MINEEKIAEGCRRGDNEARRQLYEEYAGLMFGVCLRYVGNRTVAEDVLHDGFIKVFSDIHRFRYRGKGSLKAWLTVVQRSVIIEHIRRESKFHFIGDTELPDIPEPETTEAIPDDVLEEMIASLPIGYRTVFNLYVIDGLSHREIAKMLGIKERSSSSQLLRARRLLAQMIKDKTSNSAHDRGRDQQRKGYAEEP